MPYLLDRGIKTLDYCIITHFDSDHCNGFIEVFEKLKVKVVIISKQTKESEEYKDIIEIIMSKKIPIRVVKKGDKINLDKQTYIDILYPDFKISEKDLNNNSIVCKLNYGKFSMLFTGDIETPAEKHLVGVGALDNPIQLQSTIIKVAHHGSKSSSTEEFIKRVNPQIALIGVRKAEIILGILRKQ